jgi:hypothetical protein
VPIEKVIAWNEADKLFEPIVITAELVQRGKDIDIPMEVGPIELDPAGMIELTPHESSTPEQAMWRAKVTKELLGDEDFYEKVKEPVTVTITVSPIESDTLSLVLAGPVSISQTCTVRIEPPKPTLHWRGPPYERDDAPIEVDADAEHEIELHTWVQRYQPATKDVGPDTKGVEFTHKTEPGFDPRMFGPHPDDLPWIVAPANGPNNREFSKWKAMAALPHPDHPGRVPPVHFKLSTKAWQRGSITERIKNEVRWKKDPLLEVDIPFVLVPVRLVAELIRPEKPFAADDMTYDATLKISRERDRKPLKKGVISWEIKADTSLGGKVTPDQAKLTEAAAGEVTFEYTPPILTYKPNGRYHEDLVVYLGAGPDRREIGVVPLLLRPAIKAQISLTKRGLTLQEGGAGVVDLTPEYSASEFHGSPTLEVRNSNPELEAKEPICHADMEITCEGTPVHGEIKTDEKGAFVWKLPELDEVFVKLPDERVHDLIDNELPRVRLDDKSEEVIALYDDKLVGYAPLSILSAPLVHDLRSYRMAYGANIARRPPLDYPSVVSATDLLRVATASASSWQPMYYNNYQRAITDLGNFALDLASTLVTVFEVGEKSAKALASGIKWAVDSMGAPAARVFFWLTSEFAAQLRVFGASMLDAANAIAARLPDDLRAMVQAAAATGQAAIESLCAILGLTDRGEWGANILAPLADGIFNLIRFVLDFAWATLLAVLWLGAKAAETLFDSIGTTLGPVGEAELRRTGKFLSELFGSLFTDKKVWDTFTFGKGMELLFNELVKRVKVAREKLAGSAPADYLASQLDWFTPFTHDAFTALHRRAVDLVDIPAAAATRIDAYDDAFRRLNQTMNLFHTKQIFIDLVAGTVDVVVLVCELLAALVGTITSAGFLNPATLAPLFTTLEIVVGTLKTVVVRVPQFCASIYWGGQVQMRYHTHTMALMPPAVP